MSRRKQEEAIGLLYIWATTLIVSMFTLATIKRSHSAHYNELIHINSCSGLCMAISPYPKSDVRHMSLRTSVFLIESALLTY